MWSFIETTGVFLLSLMLTGRALRSSITSSNVSCSSPSSHRSLAHTPSEYFWCHNGVSSSSPLLPSSKISLRACSTLTFMPSRFHVARSDASLSFSSGVFQTRRRFADSMVLLLGAMCNQAHTSRNSSGGAPANFARAFVNCDRVLGIASALRCSRSLARSARSFLFVTCCGLSSFAS